MKTPATAVLGGWDLARMAFWICANGMAGLLATPLMSRSSFVIAVPLFGLVLGAMQSAAVSRTWREALAWTALTAMGLGIAMTIAIVPLFGAVSTRAGETWITAGILSLPLGAGMSGAQAVVLALRNAPARLLGIWVVGNALAAAVVGALAFARLPDVPAAADLARALSPEIYFGVVRAALGMAFGILTIAPLVVVLIEARAAQR
ncbi:MAG TPA: hypothetical protein VJP45_14020 [Candidatus Limnocylindria bacterium]|nr:hypothetical protein [Candidatus Limnocylindria bacterium]